MDGSWRSCPSAKEVGKTAEWKSGRSFSLAAAIVASNFRTLTLAGFKFESTTTTIDGCSE